MQENLNVAVNNQEVAPATETTATQPVDNGLGVQQPRSYTKDQVVELMRRRVERSHNSFFNRYGVKDLKELDALFQKTSDYDRVNQDYGNLRLKNEELAQEISFLKNNISPERYDDIKTYFKGKGIDFTNESLLEAIKTHPEWVKPNNVTTIQTLGLEGKKTPAPDEKKIASKFFGVDL